MDFSVHISAAEAADIVDSDIVGRSVSARQVDRYEIVGPNGGRCIVLVYDKYFMRTSSRASLTVVINDLSGVTGIHAAGSGGGEGALFSFDWGAGQSFAYAVEDALKEYKL